MNKTGFVATIVSLALHPFSAAAADNLNFAEVRVALVSTLFSPKPDQLNADTAPSQIDEMKGITGFSLEGSQPILSWLKAGIRGGGNYNKMTANNGAGGINPYFLAAQQSWLGGILRFSLVQTKVVRFDLFGEGGLMKNVIDVRTSGGEGTYKSDNVYSRFGASFAVGWDKYYLFFEGGPETNKLANVERSGTTNAAITSLDLSGTYFALGLFFNGIPGLIKPGR